MMRTPIPACVFYHELQQHGPMTIEEIGLASRSHTMRMIALLRAAEKIHIVGWRGTLGAYRMVLAAGPGIDAPRPKLDIDEVRRRTNAAARRRAASKRPAPPPPPPPSLPTHNPTIGFWGL